MCDKDWEQTRSLLFCFAKKTCRLIANNYTNQKEESKMSKIMEVLVAILLAVILVSIMPESLLGGFSALCGAIIVFSFLWTVVIRLKEKRRES